MKHKMTISLLIGMILSAIALYFAFRRVPFGDLLKYLSVINYFWIIPSALMVLLAFAIRAMRWQIILMTFHPIKFWQAFHPLMIGFMLNCILPGRIGEVARPAVLKKKQQVSFSTGLATVAAERILDALFLIGFLSLIFSTIDIDPTFQIDFGQYSLNRDTLLMLGKNVFRASIFLTVCICLVALDNTRATMKRMIRWAPNLLFFISNEFKRRIEKTVCRPLTDLLDHAAQGFLLLKHPKQLAYSIVLTIVIWLSSGLSYYLMGLGCPGVSLSFYDFMVVMIIICFFIALPSVPGFWGVWEAGGVFAMALFGVSNETAAGFTLANHVVQVFPVIVVGLISSMLISINIRQIASETTTD